VSKRLPVFSVTTAANIVAITMFVFVSAACGSKAADAGANAAAEKSKPSAFTVTDAQRARLQIVTIAPVAFRPNTEVTGTVAFDGDHSTQILSPISGPVTRLLVQVGAQVSAGQALATVSSPDFAAAVAGYRKAIEAARNAQRILKLNEQLFQNDALARSQLDQSRTDAAAAAADLDASMQVLKALGVDDNTVAAIRAGTHTGPVESAIRSPIAGTVVEKLVNPGQLLTAGTTPAFTVANLNSMWVLANVYERDLAGVHRGESVEIVTDASPKPISGVVDYVAALVDPGTKATTVRITVNNTGLLLKRDMFVRVNIRAASDRKGLLLPVAALLRDNDNLPFVFVIKADGTFERRKVTVGPRMSGQYEALTGLAAGDKVVADGALFIQFAENQ
jgi:cobalt-zinc-cadmium efflux system membrane fusion protein